ncbi:uncharacterized protein [Typha latifolia]|uniref:uncharacterized protein n=1 Tax=Typha latifolia TaxID=4733 RepID=UPI003C2B1E13
MSIEISSPSLYDLHIVIGDTVRDARVRFAPTLECARISVCCPEWRRFASDYIKILGDLTGVTSLSLCGTSLACLSLVPAPATMVLPFHKLIVLELRIGTISKEICDGFACLLRLMPHLELLEIEGAYGRPDQLGPPPEDYWEKQEPFHCLNHSLKRVYTNYINLDDVHIMRIIRFILLNAKVLQLMDIGYSDHSEVQLQILEELNKLQMASSHGKLVFYSPGGSHVSTNCRKAETSGSASSEDIS